MHMAIDNFPGDSRRTYAVESTSHRHNHLNSADAASFLSQFASASRSGDCARCLESTSRLSAILMDNRNRSRLAGAGAACVLATAFRSFAGGGSNTEPVLKAILAAMVLFFPIDDEEVFLDIGSPESLDSIVSILKYGDSLGKLNALLLLKEIVCFDRELARAAARIDGLIEALMSVIRAPISPRDSKTSLLATFHLVVSADEWVAKSFVKMGLVDLIIEFIVDSKSERKMSEAALAAFDRLCGFAEGREKAYENALTVPVLVVRMFGISDLATEFAVSSLWKLCTNWKGGEENGEMVGCVIEALQDGVFLKLLMLLQVECSKVARESATKLLKFLKNYGTGLECIDTMDFRGLRRPF
ncbi:hypothetical protein IEQ34_003357 [Dendrobium chrysotoxum]|uniref:U-box domain-containing protein n=1 Tax=Dendrobium chrysotoxum TaxID=161865 RepID=A0AAV7HJG6_DENCH|nr:hypothetical protein IEQ34_003357 [Dendrobium chrysotoxum]